MTRRRKITILAITLLILSVPSWVAYKILYTLYHIPQAYAAWDTGTLLVEFMKSHNDHWPKSWDDLISILNTDAGHNIMLEGLHADDTPYSYARTLHEQVAIDWNFDPRHPDHHNPVTRLDGSPFPIVWYDPNDMARDYLTHPTTTESTPTTQPP